MRIYVSGTYVVIMIAVERIYCHCDRRPTIRKLRTSSDQSVRPWYSEVCFFGVLGFAIENSTFDRMENRFLVGKNRGGHYEDNGRATSIIQKLTAILLKLTNDKY